MPVGISGFWRARWDPRGVAPLAPIVMLLLVCILANAVREFAELSDGSLQQFEVAHWFDSWKLTLEAASRDFAARIGWAGAFAVCLVLWFATVGAACVTLCRPGPGGLLVMIVVTPLVVAAAVLPVTSFSHRLEAAGGGLALVGIVLIGLRALKPDDEAWRRRLWTAGTLGLVVGAVLWVMHGWPLGHWMGAISPGPEASRQVAIVAPPFDNLLLELGNDCAAQLAGRCPRGVYLLDRLVGGLAVLALAFLALAAAAVIDQDRDAGTLEGWRRGRTELERLLFLAAGLLVSSLLVAKSLQQWPLSVASDGARVQALQRVADQWLALLGTYWTLMLAAIFIPPALFLSRRALRLWQAARDGGQADSMERWLELQGFRSTMARQFMTVLSLLAPWLAGGPLAGVADWLKASGG